MLLDRAGQMLSSRGRCAPGRDDASGALLAGSYASSREMARLLKEDSFRVLVQEGTREKIFTETVDDRWLLVVVFDHQAHLGLVKVLAKRATQSLASVSCTLVIERTRIAGHRLPGEFRRAAVDTIDLIFNDDEAPAPESDDGKKLWRSSMSPHGRFTERSFTTVPDSAAKPRTCSSSTGKIPQNGRSDLLSIATETERTLFFDFLPLDLGKVHGFYDPLSPVHRSGPDPV